MFIPYGLFVSYVLKLKDIKIILLLTTITSATIEFTQLLIGRVFDVDDIILNIIGGIVGFILYRLLEKIESILPNSLKNNTVYNIFVILILIIMFSYLGGCF